MLHVYKNYGYFAWISFRRCHLSKCFKNFVEELVKFFFLVFLSRLSKKVLHHAKAYEVKRCVNFFQSETKTFLIQKKKIFDLHVECWVLNGNFFSFQETEFINFLKIFGCLNVFIRIFAKNAIFYVFFEKNWFWV